MSVFENGFELIYTYGSNLILALFNIVTFVYTIISVLMFRTVNQLFKLHLLSDEGPSKRSYSVSVTVGQLPLSIFDCCIPTIGFRQRILQPLNICHSFFVVI
jgi:hypothetical protein